MQRSDTKKVTLDSGEVYTAKRVAEECGISLSAARARMRRFQIKRLEGELLRKKSVRLVAVDAEAKYVSKIPMPTELDYKYGIGA